MLKKKSKVTLTSVCSAFCLIRACLCVTSVSGDRSLVTLQLHLFVDVNGRKRSSKHLPVPVRYRIHLLQREANSFAFFFIYSLPSWRFFFSCCLALFPHNGFCNRSTCIMVTLPLSRNFGSAVSGKYNEALKLSNTHTHAVVHCRMGVLLRVLTHSLHMLSFLWSAMEPGAATPTTLCL